jgi:hypothetical protein
MEFRRKLYLLVHCEPGSGMIRAIHDPDGIMLHQSRSGLVVKFVLAMHEPRVRFTAATVFC